MQVDQQYDGSDIFTMITQYPEGLEIEYKIAVDAKLFIDILNSFRHLKGKMSQTTNAIYTISSDRNSMYNFIISKDYITNQITKYTKRRLLDANCDDFTNIKMSASTEKPSEKPSSAEAKASLYRIKNRISFECGDWRYDFTQSVQHSSKDKFFNDNTVRTTAKSLFGDIGTVKDSNKLIDAYIDSCDNPIIHRLEIEVELIVKPKLEHFTTHSFLDCLTENRKFVKERLYMNLVLSSIASLIAPGLKGPLSLKRLLNSSETLTKTTYNKLFPPIGYLISNKADGKCGLLALMESGVVFVITDKLEQLNMFDYEHSGGSFKPVTLVEGELMSGKDNAFLVYDVIMNGGNLTIDQQYLDRIPISVDCCKQFTGLPIEVRPKKAFPITEDIHTSLKHIMEYKFPYPSDGYILTEPNKNYFNTACYKIKEHNTIDFLTIELPERNRMALPLDDRAKTHDVFLLFCSISPQTLELLHMNQLSFFSKLFYAKSFKGRVPVHFAPPDNPYAFIWYVNKKDSKMMKDIIAKQDSRRPWLIVELEPISVNGKHDWKLERIRHDRYNEPNYFGNDYTRVALHNWEASQNPVKISEMHMAVSNYFKTGKEESYNAQTNAMSIIKYQLFEMLFSAKKGSRLIDFAVGKGQDLNKYLHHKVANLLGIDVDRVALSELLSRYYDIVNKRNSNMSMSITIMQQDLTADHKIVDARIRELWANQDGSFDNPDLLVCNLALHYFTKTLPEMMNFASLLKSLMPSGSMFMYTTFDGKSVFDLLRQTGEWVAHVEGSVKYRIVRKYVNDTFSEYGQTIGVKLPFTNDEMYEENLVNVANFNMILCQMGMEVVSNGSFSDMFELLRSQQAPLWRKLSEDDKKFISLYQYTILRMK